MAISDPSQVLLTADKIQGKQISMSRQLEINQHCQAQSNLDNEMNKGSYV